MSDRSPRDMEGSLPCTKTGTTFARLHGAGQLFAPPCFHHQELPPLVQDLLDMDGNVDNLANRNYIVVSMNITIEQPVVPKAISCLSILIDVFDFASVLDPTFSPQRGERTHVGVHGREDDAGIGHLAIDIARTIIPVHTNRVDGKGRLVVHVQEFHDACEIVGFSRRLTHEIDMIWRGRQPH